MMKRLLLAALLVGLLVPRGTGALADSAINVTQPKDGVPYSAAPIRSNFGAAASDINGLLSMHVGASPPVSPMANELWMDQSGGTTNILRIWNANLGQWVYTAAFDTAQSLWITNVGGGLPVSLSADDTTDLGSVPNAVITITGGGPIFSFGTSAPPGVLKVLTFTGATQIVDNAISMILPGGGDINTATGDMVFAVSLGSGNWQVMFFQTAGLTAAQGGTGRTSLTNHAVLLGSGTSPVNFAVPATAGYPLLSTGASGDPAFGQIDLAGTAVTGILPLAHLTFTIPNSPLVRGTGTNFAGVSIGSNLTISGSVLNTVSSPTFTNLNLSGTASIFNLLVTGPNTVVNGFQASGTATIFDLLVTGPNTVVNGFQANGVATLGSTLSVSGATTLGSTLLVSGAATVGGNLLVNGSLTTLTGDIIVLGTAQAATINATGSYNANGTAGVTCAPGAPSGAFAVQFGIVIAC